jgi:hypothetical protein
LHAYHRPLAEKEQETHEPGLYRYHEDEDGETSQSARAQVDQEDGQTDYQLDRSGPAHVKELASEVDARDVSEDAVDQFSIGVDVVSASGERKSLVVDRIAVINAPRNETPVPVAR